MDSIWYSIPFCRANFSAISFMRTFSTRSRTSRAFCNEKRNIFFYCFYCLLPLSFDQLSANGLTMNLGNSKSMPDWLAALFAGVSMSPLLHFCHRLVLGLLLGGMVMLALIVTPPLFLQLGIDQASQATAVIFPLYFRYVLLLFTLGLGLSLLLPKGRWWKLQLVLWAFGLSANLVQLNWLLPEAESLRTPNRQLGDNPQ